MKTALQDRTTAEFAPNKVGPLTVLTGCIGKWNLSVLHRSRRLLTLAVSTKQPCGVISMVSGHKYLIRSTTVYSLKPHKQKEPDKGYLGQSKPGRRGSPGMVQDV